MGKVFIDYNLLGIIISSLLLIITMAISYTDTNQDVVSDCKRGPTLNISENYQIFDNTLLNIIKQSHNRVIVASPGTDQFLTTDYINAFKNAQNNGAFLSFFISENSSIHGQLRDNGFTNITVSNVSYTLLLCDNQAILYSPLFTSKTDDTPIAFVTISDCQTGIDDIANYFNFQCLGANDKSRRIQKLKDMAKTSLTIPLYIDNGNESLYFFHNSPYGGEVGRFDTSEVLPSIIYNTPYDVKVYLESIPSLDNDQIGYSISFFTMFKRLLIAKQHKVRYLVPKSCLENMKHWLDATAAFSNAEIGLYENKQISPNYIILGDRTFVLSHPMKGKIVDEEIGFHISSNSHSFSHSLQQHFDEIWNVSQPYSYNQTRI